MSEGNRRARKPAREENPKLADDEQTEEVAEEDHGDEDDRYHSVLRSRHRDRSHTLTDLGRRRQSQEYTDDLTAALGPVLRAVQRVGGHRVILVAIGALVLLWLGSGVYQVGPGERGVVLTFGQVTSQTEPGLRYRLPWPVQSHRVVDIAQVRRAEIGFATTSGGVQAVPRQASMLTGDENIVQIEMVVQYVVQDPVQFLFRLRDAEAVLRTTSEVALRAAVGQQSIEFTMTDGRVAIQDAVKTNLQNLLNAYHSGLLVTEARLLAVDPPREVRDAFNEVVRAFEDRDRLVQEAQAYAERVVPLARGESAQMVREAEAYREQRLIRARGDAERFRHILEEYRHATGVTRERLYLEAIERALLNAEVLILDGQSSGVNPLLPLRPLTGSAPVTATPAPAPTPAPTRVPTQPAR